MPMTPFAQFDPAAFDVVITCAEGLEHALLTELDLFGLTGVRLRVGRVKVTVALADFYHLCLYSRVASRILLPIGEYHFRQKTQTINQVREIHGKKTHRTVETKVIDEDVAEALYEFASRYDWTALFEVKHTFAIRLSTDKRLMVNQQFATLRIKDAIADCFNRKLGERPNVDKSPDFHIYAHATPELAELYLDLSGVSLHRRGYRVINTEAPLKENLACALLYECGWHEGRHTALIDPMCGSGTLITEALLMKTNYPVGIDKKASDFGFYEWQHHDDTLWHTLANDALMDFHDKLDALRVDLANGSFLVLGLDADAHAIRACHQNVIASALAPIAKYIRLEQRPLARTKSLLTTLSTNYPLIITNPPYGERLGDTDFIKPLYQGLGLVVTDGLRASCQRADMAVLASHVEHADTLPLIDPKTLKCHNGALTVYFRHGMIDFAKTDHWASNLMVHFAKKDMDNPDSQEFINRLQKNIAHLKKHAQKDDISNMRIYDADLPNFNVAIDVYGDKIHVQEYAPPKQIPEDVAKTRFNLVLSAIRDVFDISRERIFIKTRMRQSGKEQYTKHDSQKPKKMMVAHEHGAYLYVNLTDYLDAGLFIDHRNMRAIIKQESRGKDVLNLFAYTCTASVHSAMGGAKSVTSVDLSANYLNWGKQNFALNGLDVTAMTPEGELKYQFINTDVFDWLKNNTSQFELIFIDPPTFSNSKKFQGTFDVQRDHAALISRAMNRLASQGVLYFSNNFTKFQLDDEVKHRYEVVEMTDQTIGVDFNPKKPIHRSFKITHKNQNASGDYPKNRPNALDEKHQDKLGGQDRKSGTAHSATSSDKKPSRQRELKHEDPKKPSHRPKHAKNHEAKSFNEQDKKRKITNGNFKDDRQKTSRRLEESAPKLSKPKVHYEKIDGKLIATTIEAAPSETTKKYTVKPKS